jgi:hypothetical protein
VLLTFILLSRALRYDLWVKIDLQRELRKAKRLRRKFLSKADVLFIVCYDGIWRGKLLKMLSRYEMGGERDENPLVEI